MAVHEWFEIYQGYSPAALEAELTRLQKAAGSEFSQHAAGSVSHSKDLGEVKDKLQAATRVQRHRRGGDQSRMGTVDFGSVDFGDL